MSTAEVHWVMWMNGMWWGKGAYTIAPMRLSGGSREFTASGEAARGFSVWKQRDATTESYQSEDSRGSPAMLTPMLGFLEASASPPLAALHSMTEMKSPGGNPHGIDHILSRPPNNVTGRGISVANMAAAAGMAAASYKHHLAELTTRSAIYWPGLQGLVSNPIAWRDRLANSKYPHQAISYHRYFNTLRLCYYKR